MALSIPNPVADHLNSLRSDISSATFLNVGPLERNSQAHVVNALALVETTPEVEAAAKVVCERAILFSRLLADQRSLVSDGRDALDHSRATALQAIDDLSTALKFSRPNATAVTLGLAWQ
jgi:hypothetical protein